jgi:quercetin dioxygenase-like cupin family protein
MRMRRALLRALGLVRVLVLVLFVVVSSASSPTLDGQPVVTRAQESMVATACAPETAGSTQPAAASNLDEGVPPGLALSVLADLSTETWPAFANSLVLTVRQLSLQADAVTDARRTQGPLLFYVASGSVGISVNGRLQPHAPGSALLVETGQNYLLRNDSADPAIVLRLALVPPDEETTVGRGDVAAVIDDGNEIAAGAESIESTLLLSADLPAMTGPMHLFLACLSWTDAEADPGEAAHPGPVGLLVLDGQLLIGESGMLDAGDCTVFPPASPRHLRAGHPPPVILMFGAVPEEDPLWLYDVASAQNGTPSARASFACGDAAEPGEPPVAAGLMPDADPSAAPL